MADSEYYTCIFKSRILLKRQIMSCVSLRGVWVSVVLKLWVNTTR